MVCVESRGRERLMAVIISASMTFSHLQTMFSSGLVYLPGGPILMHLKPSLGTMMGARLGLKEGFFASFNPALESRFTISRAMAGLPASPGESMPAAWMNCGCAAEGSMIQSPRVDLALAPQK